LNSTPLTTEKMAVFAPTPSASVSTATSVNPGRFNSVRSPNRMSFSKVLIAYSVRVNREP
jgi:hypothetical protein